MTKLTEEKNCWEQTAAIIKGSEVEFGGHWSYNYRNDPKRLAFVLARYKFAAKMASKGRSVIEFGCGEGIGAPILAEAAKSYTGIDYDEDAIKTAHQQFAGHEKFAFQHADFMGEAFGKFQTAVSLDVVEHIYSKDEQTYFETIWKQLTDDGIVIIGTPNVTSQEYASKLSKMAHVNLFDQKRLKETLERYFANVFCFGMNDEVLHTGFSPMSHYLICLACNKRS